MTKNHYKKGIAVYLGCMLPDEILDIVLRDVLKDAGIVQTQQEFPVIVRKGKNDFGKEIVFYLNYSDKKQKITWQQEKGIELFSKAEIKQGEEIEIEPWNLCIMEI